MRAPSPGSVKWACLRPMSSRSWSARRQRSCLYGSTVCRGTACCAPTHDPMSICKTRRIRRSTMKFGIFLLLQSPDMRPSQETYDHALEQGVLADQLGFDYIVVAEHH